jgi:hypothetical protein
MSSMPTPPKMVARKPRRSRKPLPQKPAPACGPIVRQVRGRRVERPAEPPYDRETRGDAADRLFTELARAVTGE